MINFSYFNSVITVIKYFHNEETCKQALIEARWGDDVVCPHCGKHHFFYVSYTRETLRIKSLTFSHHSSEKR